MKRFRKLKHYLIPHAGNKFKPALLAKESVAIIVLILFVIEGVYVIGTPLLQKTGFTAAVLPAALADMTNKDRVAAGNAKLVFDANLAKAAQAKANDMAAKSYFAHVSPDGKTPWHWLDLVGYNYSYAGENLAINFSDSIDVEEAWMNSPEHHANIVKPQYTRIGIATAQGVYEGKDTTFVVQFFATPPTEAVASAAPTKSKTPKATVATAAAPASSAPAQVSQVLGAEVAPAPVGAGAVPPAASSPNHTVTWVFGIFAAFVAVLLGIAVFVKSKVQYLEVILGGAVLIAIALSFIFLNGNTVSAVQLPRDGQAASVSLAF